MTLLLSLPVGRTEPLRWVADIVLGEMLGVPFEVTQHQDSAVTLSQNGHVLRLSSQFPDLDRDRAEWARQCPTLPLAVWEPDTLPEAGLEAPLPVLFGRPEITVSEDSIQCGADILGAVFFMLSRFEEVAQSERDQHDRFPAVASLAWRANFLYRPIVDEYAELLWAMLKRLWPGLERRRHEGRVKVSCDVDQPFDRVGTSPKSLLRSIGGDLARRRDIALTLRRTRNFFAHRRGDLRFDPYYTFGWYMDVCEANGHKAAFYFISDHSAGAIDGTYDIAEPRVLDLIRKIVGRGHEVGMHGSYNTFRSAPQITRERQRLMAACHAAAVDVQPEGNRQHYLRWDAAETPDHLEAAGFKYDTTGSFADRPGFRYGTSHSFPMWSWMRKAPLRLRQHPLVVMECSVIAKGYLGMGYAPEALALMQTLKGRALKHGGDFTLLWHNCHFLSDSDRIFFDEVLS